MRSSLLVRLLGLAIAALALPAASEAAVTVGELAASTNEACDGPNNNLVQAQSAPGRNSFALPSNGVVTAWAHSSRGISGSSLKLKVFRRVGANTFRTVGESGFRPFDETGVASNATRIPASAGDVLGLGLATNAATSPASCFDPGGGAGDEEFARAADLPPGQSGTFPAGPFPVRLNVTARLEADADRDGFGDESQDGCPTSPLSQSSCPIGKIRDTRKPGVKVGRLRTQSLRKARSLSVTLRSDETATVTGRGSITLPGAARLVRFRAVKRRLVPDRRTVVRLPLSSKNLRRVRRVLRQGKRLRAKVRLTVTDANGNATRLRRTIKVR